MTNGHSGYSIARLSMFPPAYGRLAQRCFPVTGTA